MEALRELGATDNEADGMVDALSADGWNGLGEKALTKAELQAAIEAIGLPGQPEPTKV